MLTIKEIKLQGWKGLTMTVNPGNNTLLCGPNGSGKSAVLEALRYAVEGRTSVGATAAAVATFAAPEGCKVTVVLSDGFAWTRGLSINHHNGQISQSLEIHGEGDINIKEAQATISAKCGDFAPMFDLGSGFLDLSDDKRRNFVLDLCAKAHSREVSAGYLIDKMTEAYLLNVLGEEACIALKGDVAEGLTQLPPEKMEALTGLCDIIADNLEGNVPEMISSAINICRNAVNEYRMQKDQANAACQKLAERRAALAPVAESKDELAVRLAKVNADILDREKAISSQLGRASARETIVSQFTAAKVRLENYRGELAGLTRPETSTIDAVRAEANKLAGSIDGMSNLSERLTAAMRANQEASNALLRLSHEKEVLEERTSGDWAELHKRLNDALDATEHDYQKPIDRNGEWNLVFKIIARHTATLEADRARLAALPAEVEAARAARVTANDQEKAVEEERDTLSNLRAAHADCMRQLTELDRLATKANSLQQNVTTWEGTVAELEKKLAEFDGQAVMPLDDLRAGIETLKAEALRITQQQELVVRSAALDAEHATMIESAERSAVKWRVAQELGESVKSLRSELMEELTRPLLAPMTTTLQLFDAESKAYCRLEKENGAPILEIGWQRGERKTAYEALSGGEKCLVGAALARALIELANPPLKLLMLEAGEVDSNNLQALCSSCSEFAGTVLLATWADVILAVRDEPNWTVVNMEPSAAMQEAVA